MAYNDKLTLRVREALAHLPDVEEKRMFRGVAFMVNGKMCITVGDDEMMLRIDPSLHEELLENKPCRTVIMRGREYKGWILVNEDDIQRKKEFEYWVSLALDFNKKAKVSVKRKKK